VRFTEFLRKKYKFSEKQINLIIGRSKMTKPIHPQTLFRLSVIGSLTTRADLAKGELRRCVQEMAKHAYDAPPDGRRVVLSSKTIERWYYLWKKEGIDGLAPKERLDSGKTQIADDVQSHLVKLKKEQPSRSINTLIRHLEVQGLVEKNELSRSSVHRFLKHQSLSKQVLNDSHHIERRAFEALLPGDIWQSDVLHGPTIMTSEGSRKTYLISFLDDASRLVCHGGFYFSESALALEHALKQALLRRGMPKMLIIDNGPAYRSKSLETVCARLGIHLVHCRPYEPQGKGKLERWHRTVRNQFLDEINFEDIRDLDKLNELLWIWLEHDYHQRSHEGLEKDETPLSRWRKDADQIRQLGAFSASLDEYFYHRIKRKVRKDGVVSWEGKEYEVPFEYSGDTVYLVVDPHQQTALTIESLKYHTLGPVFLLDRQANCQRRRQRPTTPPPALTAGTKFVQDLAARVDDTSFDVTNTTLERE